MKTLILAAIRCSLMFTAVAALSVRPAQAGYVLTLHQVGSNVVATGSGAIDLTGLTPSGTGSGSTAVFPSAGGINVGTNGSLVESFNGLNGPTSFGSGGFRDSDSGSGDFVGIAGDSGDVIVPQAYTSGNPLSSMSTYNGVTLASLGVTPGTYEWTWGTGANQNFTLQIGPATVPDGGSTVSLLGCVLFGLAVLRRRLSR